MFDLLEAVHTIKDELKYFISKYLYRQTYSFSIQIALFLVADGALCVAITGVKMKQMWCAINLASTRQTRQPTLVLLHPLNPSRLISSVLDTNDH